MYIIIYLDILGIIYPHTKRVAQFEIEFSGN